MNTANEKAGRAGAQPAFKTASNLPHGSITPDERAARFHHALSGIQEEAAGSLSGYDATLNLAEALVNAARCCDCAFFERSDKACHAYPARIGAGGVGVWPKVPPPPLDWCGGWRAA